MLPLSSTSSDLVIILGTPHLIVAALVILFAVLVFLTRDRISIIGAGVLTVTAATIIFLPNFSREIVIFGWITGGAWLLLSGKHNRASQDVLRSEMNTLKSQVYELRSALVLNDI